MRSIPRHPAPVRIAPMLNERTVKWKPNDWLALAILVIVILLMAWVGIGCLMVLPRNIAITAARQHFIAIESKHQPIGNSYEKLQLPRTVDDEQSSFLNSYTYKISRASNHSMRIVYSKHQQASYALPDNIVAFRNEDGCLIIHSK